MASLSDSDSDSDFEDDQTTLMVILLAMMEEEKRKSSKRPCRTSKLSGHEWVQEILNGNPTRIYEQLRMGKRTFALLCEELQQYGGLNATNNVSVEEQVAIFLKVVGHSWTTRDSAERFQHSTATISKYFRIVLKAVNKIAERFIKPPDFGVVPPRIKDNPNFDPYFKDAVGAIDGVHIDAVVPTDEQVSYRGRKIKPTQNVLCVCSFDMLFTYVIAGWEGSANDARILMETISNPDNLFPMPPKGKYYLVDSGFQNIPGFLAPYRGATSHFQEMRRRGGPKGRRELFNFRHSSLRNVIERCFGVLKARFPILKFMRSYSLRKQTSIVIACCVLHNFIKIHARHDAFFRHYENYEDEEGSTSGVEVQLTEFNVGTAASREMTEKRDEIANQMWNDYNV